METETIVRRNGNRVKRPKAEAPAVISAQPALAEIVEKAIPKIIYVSRVTGEHFESQEALHQHYSECRHVSWNQMVVTPEFQNYIPAPPRSKESLRSTYQQNDELTVNSWWAEWKANKIENWKSFDILKNSVMSEHPKWAYRPCIIAGSGPSLKRNAQHLLNRKGIGMVSCLHNFGFFHDMGIRPDYYLNLDAGDITIPEMSQGGGKGEDYYWDASAEYTLVTALHCNPKLHKKWKGKILWFDTALQGMNEAIEAECPGIRDLNVFFQTGGNTLGASHYLAKAVLGANPLIFVGADLSFSHDRKFHPFDSPYDKQFAGVVPCTDVFGYRVATWPSYFGFKTWFEHMALGGLGNRPGTYINATEGGILGAYPEGNMMQIPQRRLAEVITEYTMHDVMPKIVADKTKIMSLY